ncbi:hypothetical protein BpHYR1_038973 [Brachionus plicatilis]|uniref:Uncharacterized protein n=1 Tax=Brachionus plicatilis TaxID=10195 RepID=A0A3M7QCI0_BRAPC|nr:hypothetical protein BpHYR1_038973 [Brachionus plicatilis]
MCFVVICVKKFFYCGENIIYVIDPEESENKSDFKIVFFLILLNVYETSTKVFKIDIFMLYSKI